MVFTQFEETIIILSLIPTDSISMQISVVFKCMENSS